MSSRPFSPIHCDADFERFIGKFTSYEHMKDFRYSPDTMKLDRMARFMRRLEDPQLAYPSVHVAGTKGKGSTCLMLECLLAASGRKVGTYLSPHVEHLRERIRLQGASISELGLCACLNGMLEVLEDLHELGEQHFPTFFELMTGVAMVRFQKEAVDCGIFEVGLGGRLDATNILPSRWTAITGIGLEHTQKLGNTLTQIAWEKAGIIKPEIPVVLGQVADEARVVILEAARCRRAPILEVSPSSVQLEAGGRLKVEGFSGSFAPGVVRGPGLRNDLALAVVLWREILRSSGEHAARETLQKALDHLRLPARVEVFGGTPSIVIDGAHTPESIASLRQALEEIDFPRPRALVLAMASDKRMDAILQEIQGLAEVVLFTRSDAVRSVDPRALAERCQQLESRPAESLKAFDDPSAAFHAACERGMPVVVTGSFYLAGKLRPLAERRII
ncbi:MAG: hypothetical protein HY717_15865 [Planctomycetes bacterium]|nr:hypothetical protein [Planctomycetota bacterium]